jgi:hypothetical protein
VELSEERTNRRKNFILSDRKRKEISVEGEKGWNGMETNGWRREIKSNQLKV